MSTWQPSEPDPAQTDPRRVAELLDRTTRRLGGPTSATTSTVFSRWEEIVGPDIAAHARPVSLHRGVLMLAVDHPAWATQLRYMTADLLTRISEATTPTAPSAPGTAPPPAAPPEIDQIHLRVVGERTGVSPPAQGRKPPS